MNTIKVNTNIHCQSCIDKLKPELDSDSYIDHWAVDLDSELKTLTVSGEGVTKNKVAHILSDKGYVIVDETITGNGFWSDTTKWRRASFNTLNCLIGCSLGDFGMIIFLQAYYPETSMVWQMILAIIAGLTTSVGLETMILKYREGFNTQAALKTALGMSFISMVGMEIAMNTTDLMITGGKAAFDDPMYWTALLAAMVAGFLAPLPYNYYRLKKFNAACH